MKDKAKVYSSIRYTFVIFEFVYLFALLIALLSLGLSSRLYASIVSMGFADFFILPAYLFILFAGYYILNFPLNFAHSFLLEHKFALTRQRFLPWLVDQLKVQAISYLIVLICLEAFYYIVRVTPGNWWWIISILWIFFSLILARFTPQLIIPLFFKYKKIENDDLKSRIMNLADKMKVKILDVFEIDFSKKTLKANAAFVGTGNTRRVLLADTLKDKYTQDEIEVILAHEFAHCRLRHLIKLLIAGSLLNALAFYAIFKTSTFVFPVFGFLTLSDISGLPVMFIYFMLFGLFTQPLSNYISRKFEFSADTMAIRFTGLRGAFISTMEKLSTQNLADRKPHPLIKFLFFDHPPIDERIKQAERLEF